MGSQKGVVVSSDLLPVGFRFMPTDEELVTHYLMNKACSRAVPVADAIQEIDATRFYSNHPKNLVTFSDGEREWFFFIHEDDESCSSHAQRKRTVREVGNGLGFWKPNGSENPICNEDGNVFATKIYLTYFSGSCHSNKPKRTHWKMVEYHLQIRREWVVLGRLQRGMDYTGF
ncbi:putative transcription factor NAM family [Rosa chinensis]|uniref:Putative transcription factor NAM family n=1 Tax=Rosa chinensis TaxID=74649 RepID=A0A2P6QSM8_ROSCH|nr:putative transcription factor NAM family [Rosa chinensis]